MILDKIVETKKQELAALYAIEPEVRRQAEQASACLDFIAALRNPNHRMAVIAEVKKASPSKGVIRQEFDPVAVAQAYEKGGADAISVLTDQQFFQGDLQYLTAIKKQVSVPVFRKDFIIDKLQVYQARAAGADALLLIAAILSDEQLSELYQLAQDLGMQALIEVHSKEELERVLPLAPKIIGINNRDLRTFHTDLATTARLLPYIPDDILVVSESGISTPEHIRWLSELGVRAVLVGEHLMRQQDLAAAIRELMRAL
jgi:indole-3-glycerol phosphate synthase